MVPSIRRGPERPGDAGAGSGKASHPDRSDGSVLARGSRHLSLAPMAKPEKRKVEGGRVTPKGTSPRSTSSAPASSPRYTPPSARDAQLPSPLWVPVLMFTLLALGILVILLNYVQLLPGATDNWYLLLGLGLILGGIVTATQYR